MAVGEPKGVEHWNEIYMLAQQLLGGNVGGTRHREGERPETEIWHVCQRSVTQWVGVGAFLVLMDAGRPPQCILLMGLAKF